MTTTTNGAQTTRKVDLWTVALCWITVLLEGFDLVVLPAVSLILQMPSSLGWSQSEFASVATLSYVGVAIGAICVGPLADRLGRRKLLIGSVILFSVFTLLVPLTSSPEAFGLLRLIAGLGLGACMPVSLTMMAENLPDNMRARASTFTMTGYHAGAVIAALLALRAHGHWEYLFYVAGGLGLIVATIQWFKLPESQTFLEVKDQKAPLTDLFKPNYLRAVLGIWVASFMGLLLVYGLNTWLPKLMADANYPVTSSVAQLFVLNLGGIAGLIIGGTLVDRAGLNKILNFWFLAGAVMLTLLSIKTGSTFVLSVAVFLTGVFIFSAQVLVYAYATKYFPAHLRSTALGSASGVGRIATIISPTVMDSMFPKGEGYPGGFYLFAGAAVLGLLAVMTLPKADKVRDVS